jgi:hypothetical protein
MKTLNYFIRILAVISHFLNVLTGGSRFFTFSARTYYCSQVLKLRGWNYIEIVIDTVFFFQPKHCKVEYDYESVQHSNPYR